MIGNNPVHARVPPGGRVHQAALRTVKPLIPALALALALSLAACREQPSAPATAPTVSSLADAIARVGSATLSREQLEAELKRRGPSVGAQQIVDEWIRFQATLAKARAAGYDSDPRLVAQWERLVVSQFQEELLSRQEAVGSTLTEAALWDYYGKHADRFAVPAATRVAVLCVKVSPKATLEKRQERAAEVEVLRQQAAGLDAAAFAELIRQRSDDPATRYRGGDVGWLTHGMAVAHWEPPVMEVALQLEHPDELSPVIETDQAFYLARLLERRSASVRPFAEVEDLLRHQFAQDQLRERYQDFTRTMRAGLQIEVNQPLIDSLASPALATERSVPALPGS